MKNVEKWNWNFLIKISWKRTEDELKFRDIEFSVRLSWVCMRVNDRDEETENKYVA